jgi:hypothetical protein
MGGDQLVGADALGRSPKPIRSQFCSAVAWFLDER